MRKEEMSLLFQFLVGLASVWLVFTSVILPQPPSYRDFLSMIACCGVVLIIVMWQGYPSAVFLGVAVGTVLGASCFLTGRITKLHTINAMFFLAAGIVYPLYYNNRRK